MINYFLVMRPKQWTKNLIVFAGLIFANKLSDGTLAFISFQAFIIFCLLSGVVYIVNDIMDVEEDQKHPSKKMRPIASGKVNIKIVSALSGVLEDAVPPGAGAVAVRPCHGVTPWITQQTVGGQIS